MENQEEALIKGLKVEVYDLSKEVQALSKFISTVGTRLGLEGEELTLDAIAKAVDEKVAEE